MYYQVVRILRLLFVLVLIATVTATKSPVSLAQSLNWQTVFFQPMNEIYSYLHYTTVTDIIPITTGGTNLEIRLSNANNTSSLFIGALSVAIKSVDPSQDTAFVPVSFSGNQNITLQPGQVTTSDPVSINVPNNCEILVSIFFPRYSLVPAHYYQDLTNSSYIASNYSGNLTGNLPSNLTSSNLSFLIDAVEVQNQNPYTVEILGDNLAGHANYLTFDTLIESVKSKNLNLAIIDESSSSATLLTNPNSASIAPNVNQDILELPGVKAVIIELGLNDITQNSASITALETTYNSLINQLTTNHIKVILATIAPTENLTTSQVNKIKQINNWILKLDPNALNLSWLADVYSGHCNPEELFNSFINPTGDLNPYGQLALVQLLAASLKLTVTLAPQLNFIPTSNCLTQQIKTPTTKPLPIKTLTNPSKHFLDKVQIDIAIGIAILILLVGLYIVRKKRFEKKEREFYRSLGERKRF